MFLAPAQQEHRCQRRGASLGESGTAGSPPPESLNERDVQGNSSGTASEERRLRGLVEMVMLGVKVVYMVVIGAGMEMVVIVMTAVLVVRE